MTTCLKAIAKILSESGSFSEKKPEPNSFFILLALSLTSLACKITRVDTALR
uniref:Uncharacterized protein n=1 Tax=Arundo donax TaxID=35708 RepID=A0A0A9GGH9_ARUDO